ncbi:MAG: YbhB/YbcL family Raf kinase inhibitor-like protein [Candidatus Hodarchaeales archaeon]
MKKITISIILILTSTLIILFLIIGSGLLSNLAPNSQAEESENPFSITSPVFNDSAYMPSEYSCEGSDVNPKLEISYIPNETQSLALIMDDPDTERMLGYVWVHWLLWNISPTIIVIEKDSVPPNAVVGRNSQGQSSYQGPCPPEGSTHHYYFRLYALDIDINLPSGSTKEELLEAMDGHIIAQTHLIGRYRR